MALAFARTASAMAPAGLAGELPAAVSSGDRVVAALIVLEGTRRTIVVSPIGTRR